LPGVIVPFSRSSRVSQAPAVVYARNASSRVRSH
jgi:hypothetical protein